MNFTRIRISTDATNKLQYLKKKTGLTPNYLARIGFCLSLAEDGLPDLATYDEDGQEFNRHTLTGDYDLLLLASLKERMIKDGLDTESELLLQFKGHLNRGASLLNTRVKSLPDFYELLPNIL
jgi:DNA sulfur modification protein DndE